MKLGSADESASAQSHQVLGKRNYPNIDYGNEKKKNRRGSGLSHLLALLFINVNKSSYVDGADNNIIA